MDCTFPTQGHRFWFSCLNVASGGDSLATQRCQSRSADWIANRLTQGAIPRDTGHRIYAKGPAYSPWYLHSRKVRDRNAFGYRRKRWVMAESGCASVTISDQFSAWILGPYASCLWLISNYSLFNRATIVEYVLYYYFPMKISQYDIMNLYNILFNCSKYSLINTQFTTLLY